MWISECKQCFNDYEKILKTGNFAGQQWRLRQAARFFQLSSLYDSKYADVFQQMDLKYGDAFVDFPKILNYNIPIMMGIDLELINGRMEWTGEARKRFPRNTELMQTRRFC